MQAGHHLIGMQPNGGLLYYRVASTAYMKPSPEMDIWRLRQEFKGLKIFFDLWGRESRWGKAGTPEAREVHALFEDIEAGRPVDRSALQKAALVLFTLAPGQYLRKMQTHADQFDTVLSQQYRELLPKLDLVLPPRSELMFHFADPELYVWVPPGVEQPRQLLVCFATRKNSFNMPRPMAHFVLARLGVGLMYVCNRPELDPDDGLMGIGIERSARLIKKVANDLGFDRLYGLGTSLGGYVVCRYAAPLELVRALNFSGVNNATARKPTKPQPFGRLLKDYPLSRILTVLSKTDPVDQKLLKAYDASGFDTPREWVDSASHGTFTAAFIEGKLPGYMAWLLGEADNTASTGT